MSDDRSRAWVETIDQAVVSYLTLPDDGHLAAIVAMGLPAFQRILNLESYGWLRADLFSDFRNGPEPPLYGLYTTLIERFGIDYVDWLIRIGKVKENLTHIAKMHDPRLVELVRPFLDEEDWLIRSNAVHALTLWLVDCGALKGPVLGPGDVARDLIESALEDPDEVVRAEAIFGIRLWDQERAVRLFELQLARLDLPEQLRKQAEFAVESWEQRGTIGPNFRYYPYRRMRADNQVDGTYFET